jgi:alpha-tubulin suppressor-like RCC1 family protein
VVVCFLTYKTHLNLQTGVGSGVVEACGGTDHVCILDSAQAVKCAGIDAQGQRGDGVGVTASSSTFTIASGLTAVSTIAAGSYHTCAMLQVDSSISCWGMGMIGQIGTGGSANAFTPMPALALQPGIANAQLSVAWLNT